jgi:hypothetical protein
MCDPLSIVNDVSYESVARFPKIPNVTLKIEEEKFSEYPIAIYQYTPRCVPQDLPSIFSIL